MKTNYTFYLFLLLTAFFMGGCASEETAPELSIESSIIDSNAEGGIFRINYEIVNARQGFIPYLESDCEWISDKQVDEESIIVTILKNDSDQPREGSVLFYYDKSMYETIHVKQTDNDKSIIIEENKINVAGEGGKYDIRYSIEGDVIFSEIEVICEEDWITDIDNSTENVISFTAQQNNGTETRETEIHIKYDKAGIDIPVSVKQDAYGKGLSFEIEIEEIQQADVFYRIIPESKSVKYICMAIEKATFEKYDSDEDFFKSDLEYFSLLAMSEGVSLEEYISGIALSGDSETIHNSFLKPDTGHYIYVYGIDESCELATEIVKKEFTTDKVQNVDMTFEFKNTIDNLVANITVLPNLPEQYYFFSTMRTEGLEEGYDMKEIIQGYLDYVIEYYMMNVGGNISDAMLSICYRGIGINSFELIADKEYVIFASAIDINAGQVASAVTESRFTCPSAESDNIIELSLESTSLKNASIRVTASNDDPYAFIIDKYSKWEGKTEEEIREGLSGKDLSEYIWRGSRTINVNDLAPDSEYIALAFGYQTGNITTEIQSLRLRTHRIGESEIAIRINAEKYFDIDSLKKLYPEEFGDISDMYKIIMPAKVSITGQDIADTDFRYNIYEGDYTDYQDIYTIANSLLAEGCPNQETYFYIPRESYKSTFTIIGMARDKEGNFGELFRKAVTITDEGISPAEEFVPNTNSEKTIYKPEKH